MINRLLVAALLMLLLALLPTAARAQSCTISSVDPLAFGIIGSPTRQVDTAANIKLTCNGTAGSTVRVCVGINLGVSTPASTTITGRLMGNGSNNSVAYQIAQTAFGGATWGDYNNTINAPGQEIGVTIAGTGSGTATVSMYGRIASLQNVPVDAYTASLTVTARNPSGGSPCSNGTGTSLTPVTFKATVNTSGSCTISATPVNFGTASSLTTGVIDATGILTATCTTDMPYTIALNAGTALGNTIAARKMSLTVDNGPGVVSYQLYRDLARSSIWGDGTSGAVTPGTGSGIAQTLSVYGRVPTQATPAGGTYKDTVIATITY